MTDFDEFDEGHFSEEEIRIIRRMLPVAFESKARRLKRKQFFMEAFYCLKGTTRMGQIRRTLYETSLGLSRRKMPANQDICEAQSDDASNLEGTLSVRSPILE